MAASSLMSIFWTSRFIHQMINKQIQYGLTTQCYDHQQVKAFFAAFLACFINTGDGTLIAHKAILSASSPVFHSMFLHNLQEKESSTINIQHMSLESCTALLSYLYGTIKQDDFWKHRLSLLGAANMYAISSLKDLCEESLLEDINTGNVLERLQEAWLYELDKLTKGCLTYLLDFGKIYDIRDEVSDFFRNAERDLIQEMFQEVLTEWKPA